MTANIMPGNDTAGRAAAAAPARCFGMAWGNYVSDGQHISIDDMPTLGTASAAPTLVSDLRNMLR
jgi:hypothetical protein